MPITTSMLDRARRFEGTVPHMYLDTAGYVTVGTGHMIASAAVARLLGFVTKASGAASSADARAAEWSAVKALPPAQPMAYYDARTSLRLSDGEIDSLLTADLSTAESGVRSLLRDYARFPSEAQEALVDMCFNLGVGAEVGPNGTPTGLRQYKRLLAAASVLDWATAADECDRNGVQAARNDETRALFRAAYSRIPVGRWNGTLAYADDDGPRVASMLLTLSQGVGGYTGMLTVQANGDALSGALTRVTFGSPTRLTIAFDGPEDVSFAGTISSDQNGMTGQALDDGDPVGSFNLQRQ